MMSEDELGRHPITLDRNGVLLDGKCRLRACEIAGVEPRFTTFEGFDNALPAAQLPYEEQCVGLIFSMNFFRANYTPSQREIARALVETPGCYWSHRVLPEARAVAKQSDLADAVVAGTLSLSEAHERALERQVAAERAAAERQRLEELRQEQPYFALHVTEGSLTLDQAVSAAAEQAAGPALAEHAERIRFLRDRVNGDIVEMGQRLIECKEMLGHGYWLPWLDREFGWTDRTARNFMAVAGAFKSEPVSDLPIDAGALYLLAGPTVAEEARAEAIERAQAGERITKAEARRLIGDDRASPDRHQQLRALIDTMRRELPDDPLVEDLRNLLTRQRRARASTRID